MFKALLLGGLLALSFSPLDAREPPKGGERIAKPAPRERGDLRRDVGRIASEIYPPAKGKKR